MTIFQNYRLSHWEELLGLLTHVDVVACNATIGKYNVFLPMDLLTALKPHLGKRVAILRSDNDIPNKQYLFRILKQDPQASETTV
jgi:hypothetical protein